MTAAVSVSSPPSGAFFKAGDRPTVTIAFKDSCGNTLAPTAANFSTAEFFVYGPRAPLQTVTAYNLENFPYRPFGGQSLISPTYIDAGTQNLTVNADGTVSYQLSAITTEASGTYTASVFGIGANQLNQTFAVADFQVGTATVEVYASGPGDGGPSSASNSTCKSCHLNTAVGGKMYMAHSPPAPPRAPDGDYGLDQLPIGACKACHNNKSYSPNPLLRKTHGVHRGEHQLAPGVAHPEYGFGTDSSLPAFLNVGFPPMQVGGTPGQTLTSDLAMEKDCTACHVNNVWKTNFSRAACGTCHDNVFFGGALGPDGGVAANPDAGPNSPNIIPATVLGPPSTKPTGCTADSDCVGGFSISIATCNVPTGNCELTYHQIMTDDSQCALCHGEGAVNAGPTADVTVAHAITEWQPPISLDGYTFKNVAVSGGTGGSGANTFFKVGDKPVLKFQLFDNTGAAVADLATNAAWAGTFIVAGPTSNPQRVFGAGTGGLNMKSGAQGTLTYDGPSQTYTYTPVATWPNNAIPPANNPGAAVQVNPSGAYTVWFYWRKTTNGIEDSVDTQAIVAFGASVPLQARQVVTQAACASCHAAAPDGFPHLALHGGMRKNGETCSTCHSQYAFDRVAGSTGNPCTVATQATDCPGFSGGWEACQALVCTVTVDPTPGIYVDYQQLVHDIHFARKREGYVERNNLGLASAGIAPGTLNYLGFNNNLGSFQEVLSPVDVRSCTNCHGSSNATCASDTDCAFGQGCSSGKCVNNAYLEPTARACITCHDAADSAAHAALNTYTPSSGAPIESCSVCHGTGAAFAVDTVHNITALYPIHLAYPRE